MHDIYKLINCQTPVEDFQSRAKVSGTIIEKLKSIDVLENMPESSQLSLFD